MPTAQPTRQARSLPFYVHFSALCVFAWAGMSASGAQAQTTDKAQGQTPAVYLQWGMGREDAQAWVFGATLPWPDWHKSWAGGQLRAQTDIYGGQWAADGPIGRSHSTLVGAGAALQWRPGNGSGPWFVEAGTGLSYIQPRFVTATKAMSTRWNFSSHLGIGFEHGVHRENEWQLRIQHSSNAGAKKPNPGQNFVQLRYARHF